MSWIFVVSRPKLVSGSAEGYSGHVDGHPREARMNHPKGLTLDERGNIYIADTMNMAIRKISDTGKLTNISEIPFPSTQNSYFSSIFVAGSKLVATCLHLLIFSALNSAHLDYKCFLNHNAYEVQDCKQMVAVLII